MKKILLKIRRLWKVRPWTKIKKSDKLYKRAKEKRKMQKEIDENK